MNAQHNFWHEGKIFIVSHAGLYWKTIETIIIRKYVIKCKANKFILLKICINWSEITALIKINC